MRRRKIRGLSYHRIRLGRHQPKPYSVRPMEQPCTADVKECVGCSVSVLSGVPSLRLCMFAYVQWSLADASITAFVLTLRLFVRDTTIALRVLALQDLPSYMTTISDIYYHGMNEKAYT